MTETQNPPAPPAEETFNWDELLPVVAAPSPTVAKAGSTIDVLKEIPAPVRRSVEVALAATVQAIQAAEKKGTNVKNVNPAWQLQRVTSPAMGEKFKGLITRYGKYRPEPGAGFVSTEETPGIEFQEFGTPFGQITIRAGEPAKYVFDKDGKPVLWKDGEPGDPVLCVRFVAKPFEARKDTKTVGTPPETPAETPPADGAAKS